ncbi:MAG: hypothetical protein MJ252_08690, partial [archaeon]|nr:hypothetical protein [archaeon]
MARLLKEKELLNMNWEESERQKERSALEKRQEREIDHASMMNLARQLEEDKKMEKIKKQQIMNEQYQAYAQYIKEKEGDTLQRN